ncbi:helix-turn-helix transcriptional regulator [Nonomuraea sp. NPDC004580]|uniref:helix-turn-helix transcriptional regulator n=1 Tax=Nonomuraea sp. NPDC004580 TaxID=3154552 RepID=UPI0033B26A86
MTGIPETPAWATRLLAARNTRGWSQRDPARELIKASDKPLTELPNLIRRIRGHETGDHRPDAFYTQLYCKAFGLTEDQLFGTVTKPVPAIALPAPAPDADLTPGGGASGLSRSSSSAAIDTESASSTERSGSRWGSASSGGRSSWDSVARVIAAPFWSGEP